MQAALHLAQLDMDTVLPGSILLNELLSFSEPHPQNRQYSNLLTGS